jgi:hypothetical protein
MISYVYVDSANRPQGQSGNNYTMSLTRPLKNITQVDLVSANIPKTYYNITNGTFVINSITITLPDGFYTPQGISVYLNSLLTGISVDYLENEGKFLFGSAAEFTMSVPVNLQSILGISGGSSIPTYGVYTTLYNSPYILLSSNAVNINIYDYVYLDIQELRNNSVIGTNKQSTTGGTYTGGTIARTFAGIPMDIQYSNKKTFGEGTDFKISIYFEHPIPSIDKLTTVWTDGNGQTISFNGVEQNSYVLRVHTLDYVEPQEPKESDEEILLRKIQRAIEDSIPPPKPETGPKRILLVGIIIGLLVIIFFLFKSRSTEVQQPSVTAPNLYPRPQVSIPPTYRYR